MESAKEGVLARACPVSKRFPQLRGAAVQLATEGILVRKGLYLLFIEDGLYGFDKVRVNSLPTSD